MELVDEGGERRRRRRREMRERPEVDEAVESEVRDEGRRGERLHSGGASGVAAVEPCLDA